MPLFDALVGRQVLFFFFFFFVVWRARSRGAVPHVTGSALVGDSPIQPGLLCQQPLQHLLCVLIRWETTMDPVVYLLEPHQNIEPYSCVFRSVITIV